MADSGYSVDDDGHESMLSPRALSENRLVDGLTATTASSSSTHGAPGAAESDEVGRDDRLLVSRMSDMLGYSPLKLSRPPPCSRPADAEPARGAARGDD